MSDQRERVPSPWDSPDLLQVTAPPDDLRLMDADDAVSAMIAWFEENFEDPAEHTPYNGKEGGYLYIHGGPYEPDEILEHFFSGIVPFPTIERATKELLATAWEWAPSISRVVPPEDEQDEIAPASAAHASMQTQIRELQSRLAEVEQALAGMGHNRPPEPLDDQPWTRQDVIEVRDALRTLAQQPVHPPDDGAAAESARANIERSHSKLGSWLARVGNAGVNAIVSEAAKRLWVSLEPLVSRLVQTIADWLMTLGRGF